MARVDVYFDGVGDLLCSQGVQREMGRRAGRVAARAQGIAPRDTGRYAASFETRVSVRRGRSRRAVGEVVNTAPYSFQVETGTSDTPKRRVLGRALDAARD